MNAMLALTECPFKDKRKRKKKNEKKKNKTPESPIIQEISEIKISFKKDVVTKNPEWDEDIFFSDPKYGKSN